MDDEFVNAAIAESGENVTRKDFLTTEERNNYLEVLNPDGVGATELVAAYLHMKTSLEPP